MFDELVSDLKGVEPVRYLVLLPILDYSDQNDHGVRDQLTEAKKHGLHFVGFDLTLVDFLVDFLLNLTEWLEVEPKVEEFSHHFLHLSEIMLLLHLQFGLSTGIFFLSELSLPLLFSLDPEFLDGDVVYLPFEQVEVLIVNHHGIILDIFLHRFQL